MSFQSFAKILEDLKKFDSLRTIHFGGFGEPLFHEDFPAILELTSTAGYRIEITTNGSLLNADMADQMIDKGVRSINVSIDSPESNNFREIRNAELEPILENLKILYSHKKKRRSPFPFVNIALVLMRNNLKNLGNISGLIEPFGIETIIITNLLPYTEEMQAEILYANETQSDSPDINKSRLPGAKTFWPEMRLKTERRCPFSSTSACFISASGDVAPCVNYLKDYTCYIFGRKKEIRKKSFGNVFDTGLDKIWTTDEYMRFRAKLAEFQFPSCSDCYFNDGCNLTKSNDYDCWANSPTCSDCLYSRRILRCP